MIFWIYALIGSGYWVMYASGSEVVEKYAVGPFWLMMMAAPPTLFFLILRRAGVFGR